jgi:peptidoglycan DL-endopeptidase CwlO
MTSTPASLGLLDSRQVAWAAHSLAVARPYCVQHGLNTDQTQRASDILLAAEITESALFMYANKFNVRSLQLPHDKIGDDHGSVGLLQQQVGGAVHSTANWGTTEQCMDVTYSVRAFLGGVPGHHTGLFGYDWLHMTNWAAAQRVQGSFSPDGGNYRKNDALAIRIRTTLWTAPVPSQVAPANHLPVGTYRVQSGDTLTEIAQRYPQTWITADSIARLNHLADKNHIVIGQLLVIG